MTTATNASTLSTFESIYLSSWNNTPNFSTQFLNDHHTAKDNIRQRIMGGYEYIEKDIEIPNLLNGVLRPVTDLIRRHLPTVTDAEIMDNRLANGMKVSKAFLRKVDQGLRLYDPESYGIDLHRIRPRMTALERAVADKHDLHISELNNVRMALPNMKADYPTFANMIQSYFEVVANRVVTVRLTTELPAFLLGSEQCSWSSCYRVKGEYGASTTVWATHENSACIEVRQAGKINKIARAWVVFDERMTQGAIMHSYGNLPMGLAQEIRRWICRRVSRANGLTGKWIYKETTAHNFVYDTECEVPYVDPAKLTWRHESVAQGTRHYTSFGYPYCPTCGGSHTEDSLQCNDCHGSRCEHCEEYHSEDEMTFVNGVGHVCTECLDYHYSYCDCCESYQVEWRVNWLENQEQAVCDSCLSYYYSSCDECGCAESNSDAIHVDGSCYCQNCAQDNIVYCEECGSDVHVDNSTYVESEAHSVCSTCLRDYYAACAECGEVHLNDSLSFNGKCEYCVDDMEEEEAA